MRGMAEPEPALRLDVPRAEALAYATDLIARAWESFDQARPEQPPVDEALRAALAAPIALGPTPVLQALEEAAVVLDHSLAQPRPRYFAFVASSGLEIAVLGDALAACHDVNLAVVSGAADLVERQTLEWLGQAFGYPVATGTFSSGGTVSNMTALSAARERALPGSRHNGLSGRPCALYASADVHESVKRAAELLGIGRDRVRAIPIDANRRMLVDACAAAIDADRTAGIAPIAVVATAGTTLTGAVDPLDGLADICEARGVWLHVDGAYGLPAALVESHARLFAGLARADSVTVDAHKWLYVPKACGVLMVREAEWLERAFSHEATYVPHDVGEHDSVDRTLEYSRPFRALKLWLALRVHGLTAFRTAIERNLAEARLFADLVKQHPELELLGEPELSVVPFRHVATNKPLDEHNRALAAALRADGRVYVSGADIDGTACLRPCFVNFRTSEEDVRVLCDVVLELGAKLG
jgi:aromatic-L-amino-acid decarboxylase